MNSMKVSLLKIFTILGNITIVVETNTNTTSIRKVEVVGIIIGRVAST